MCKSFHLPASFGCSVSICTTNCKLLPVLAPQVAAALVRSYWGSRKRLALDRIYVYICFCFYGLTFQPCSWHHWYRRLSAKWQHSLSCFILQLSDVDFEQPGDGNCTKNCRMFVFRSVPVERADAAAFTSDPPEGFWFSLVCMNFIQL